MSSSLYEPLLQSEKRLALYPIIHNDIWDKYITHRSTFWTPEEVDLTDDLKDWEKLTSDEKHYIKMILGFFAASDFIVNENLMEDFCSRVKYREAELYYQFQIMVEGIHSQQYADLLQIYIVDPEEREKLFNAVETIPIVKKKAEWCKKYIYMSNKDPVTNFIVRLVAFAVVEGIFFSGSFCSIFWLKKRGLMSGLTLSNEFISRDEGIHRDFAIMLYRDHIVNKLPEKIIYEIVESGVNLEKEFVCESIPVKLIGMNADMMCQYIEYVADHLLLSLNLRELYGVKNPFEWMNLISMESKTNFFESRVSQYSKVNSIKEGKNQIKFDENF
jgi:ribonucleoside-diphosphate reductase beta chain